MIDIPDFDYYPLSSYMLTGQKIKQIKPVPIIKIQLSSPLLERLNTVKILPNHCFTNALNTARLSTEEFPIHYVEGEVVLNVNRKIVLHGFNYFPLFNVYFDLTWEIIRPDLYQQALYYPIFNGLIDKLVDENKGLPPFWYKWREKALQELDPTCPMWWMQLTNELGGF